MAYDGYYLRVTGDPWQVFTVNLILRETEFHAQVELRYLPAPDRWYLSVRDHSTGELLVNMIPVICSGADPNDLFLPFRHLRGGKGIGSLYCLRGAGDADDRDPGEENLADYILYWQDT